MTAHEIRTTAASRLIRRSDMVSCFVAFIDCKLPGSMAKENYSIIGPGVTQSADQVINLPEAHGFNIGAAAMPNGVTNNLHVHYTAEVFMVFRGEWLFRWGAAGQGGEFVAREGDILSMPTWMFRGFTNVGPDDGWIFTSLGQDDTGGVIWDPRIIEGAAAHGLYLSQDNMLIDTGAGMSKPDEADLIRPLSAEDMATLRIVSPEEMRGRITTAAERRWSRGLLDAAIPGHASETAPVIGAGMTEDRGAFPRVTNPHGFSVEWLRIAPGQRVGPYTLDVKQVLIVKDGEVEVTLGHDESDGTVTAGAWDVFAAPAESWRMLTAGVHGAEIAVVTAGDSRARITWSEAIVREAAALGWGLDPNGYVAPSRLLPRKAADATPDAMEAA